MMQILTMQSEACVRLLQAIHAYMGEHHLSPTLRELMPLLQVSSTSVLNYRLKALEKFGTITRIKRAPRSIVITEQGQTVIRRAAASQKGVTGK